MGYAAGAWIRQAVDAGMLRGGGLAFFAYGAIHSAEMIPFIRCRFTGCGSPNDRAPFRVTAAVCWIALLAAAAATVLPSAASAAQGHWWSSTANPGFDRNTVIRVAGTASQVDIEESKRPCTLSLKTAEESINVILGPGWFLSEKHADIQKGDPLVVEGAKMMDQRGRIHLVASQVTNQRTGAILLLRDEFGRPHWAGRNPQRKH
jgi:hypothetical protein